MNLFRSEDHVTRWVQKTGHRDGETFSIAQGWQLARDLYSDRLSREWTRKTSAEYQQMFVRAGLTSEFWSLSP